MWFKVKHTQDIFMNDGKSVHTTDYYLVEAIDFIEAGQKVLTENNGDGEIEDISMLKSYKPAGNTKYADTCKVFIVKFAEDFEQENGKIKTMKYPVPFFANNNTELQKILELYLQQGLDNMRVTTVSETKWKIIL